MSDYDKKQWQAEQEARDAALELQRQKWAKAKERAARNSHRKIERLARKLSETGELTDWETEFTGSVTERLDKFGSAFHDPEKGRPADALSFAQKRVVAALNKKAKKDKPKKDQADCDADQVKRKPLKAKKGFKSRAYQPRVRQIDEELDVEPPHHISPHQLSEREPYIPEVAPSDHKPPFLRIVK